MREKVPVLVDRAALDRHAVPHGGDRLVEPGGAIDDEELGPPQAAPDEIVEHGAPSLGALTTHALDREHNLLAVLAHADDDQQRDRGRFASSRTRTTVRPESAARSALRSTSGCSTHPNRSSPCAKPGSPCPCPQRRQTGRLAHAAPGACWCQPDSCPRSARRRPACGAGKPASPGSSESVFLSARHSVRRMAPVYLDHARRCPSATVSRSWSIGPQCLYLPSLPAHLAFDYNACRAIISAMTSVPGTSSAMFSRPRAHPSDLDRIKPDSRENHQHSPSNSDGSGFVLVLVMTCTLQSTHMPATVEIHHLVPYANSICSGNLQRLFALIRCLAVCQASKTLILAIKIAELGAGDCCGNNTRPQKPTRHCVNTKPHLALRSVRAWRQSFPRIEIAQIGRRLTLLGWHEQVIPAQEVILPPIRTW